MSNIYVSKHPIIAQKISIVRDKKTSSKELRSLLQEIASLLLYEATAHLGTTTTKKLESPICTYDNVVLNKTVGLFPVLRSGLSLVEGKFIIVILAGLWLLPEARVYHLGLYREKTTLSPVEYYNKLPTEPNVDLTIILDPMVATGGTAKAVINILKEWGVKEIIMITVLCSKIGVEKLAKEFPDVKFYVGVVDHELNDMGYVVPGMGDAGDRLFNTHAL